MHRIDTKGRLVVHQILRPRVPYIFIILLDCAPSVDAREALCRRLESNILLPRLCLAGEWVAYVYVTGGVILQTAIE